MIKGSGPGSISNLGITATSELIAVSRIRVSNLKKRFNRNSGEEVLAVDDITLNVNAGEFLVLLGPSGCGKTTLLRCLAGLEHPDSGEVFLDGRVLYSSQDRVNLPPEQRRMSMLFQSYALWPHMTVFDNVAYPLRTAKVSKAEATEDVHAVLKRVECEDLAGQYPGEISGGQQQRVALARALVANNNVVLFDEPLSNVDARVRELLRLELIELQRRIGFSAIYVTHDQSEALALADRIAVLDSGRIAQLGTPLEIYKAPISPYVARFVGTLNELPGTCHRVGPGEVRVATQIGTVVADREPTPMTSGSDAVVVFRPESCRMTLSEPECPNKWVGTVRAALFLGPHVEYLIDVQGTQLRIWQHDEDIVDEGSQVWVSVSSHLATAFAEDRPILNTPSATMTEGR